MGGQDFGSLLFMLLAIDNHCCLYDGLYRDSLVNPALCDDQGIPRKDMDVKVVLDRIYQERAG